MMSTSLKLLRQTWRQDSYYISTDPQLIPIKELIDVFASDDFYWAKPLPETAMREMLEDSLNFGLFDCQHDEKIPVSDAEVDEETKPSSLKFIGLARCITDSVTFLYLTDVWVDPEYQGKGLGKWLIKCVQGVVEEMPYLRRSMLFTGDWKRTVPFYEKLMGMNVMQVEEGKGLAVMERKGRGHPSYEKEGSGYH